MAPPASSQTAPEAGDRIGPYRLEELLGQGGTGLVFRAADGRNGTVVALKVLRHELAGNPSYARRFVREARVAREIRHDHLIPIHEAGEAGGTLYLASAYVPGRTLQARLAADGPLTAREAARLAKHIGSALDHLHKAGLVHRDVKPGNIMLDETGNAYLADYGLAKGRAYTLLTAAGEVLGTAPYLAPELIRGGSATPESDVYALGCTVFESLAGEPPFATKSLFGIIVGDIEREPPDLRKWRPDLPESLSSAISTAVENDPARRPGGMAFAMIVSVAAHGHHSPRRRA